MVQIVLIRPGSTDYDQQQRIQGTLDIPLNAEGDSEVERLIGELSKRDMEILYTSPSKSSQQTAEILGKALEIKVKKLDRLTNVDHGLWQGMLVDDVRQKQPKVYRQWQEQPESVCPPEGEMLEEAETRIRAVLGKLLKRHKNGVIGLVVPEPLASLIRHHFDQNGLGNLWQASAGHGRWEILRVEPQVLVQGG